MEIKWITLPKGVFLSFILLSILISGISYAHPNIRILVCDITIIGSNHTEYEFLPLNCMDYSYWYKNCNDITRFNIESFNNTEYRRNRFIYDGSILEVNKTYRIIAESSFNLYNVRLIADSDTDLLTTTRNICQTDNLIGYITPILIILAILFIAWRIYRKSKRASIIFIIFMFLVLFFVLLYYS